MATNRKQPFGYKMVLGQITENPQEAPWVREIFRSYLSGASFLEIAYTLREDGVPYEADKPWNKNMIARILEDKRYLGDACYPNLIDRTQFDGAAQRRKAQAPQAPKTEMQKLLRRLSGRTVTPAIEQQVFSLFRKLWMQPQLAAGPIDSQRRTRETMVLQSRLDGLLSGQITEDTEATEVISQLAAARYDELGNCRYETVRIQRTLERSKESMELTPEVLKNTLSAVLVDSRGKVRLQLRNGIVIQGE